VQVQLKLLSRNAALVLVNNLTNQQAVATGFKNNEQLQKVVADEFVPLKIVPASQAQDVQIAVIPEKVASSCDIASSMIEAGTITTVQVTAPCE
jgi:hypothetical protein